MQVQYQQQYIRLILGTRTVVGNVLGIILYVLKMERLQKAGTSIEEVHILWGTTNIIGICVTGNFQDYHCPKPRFDKLMAFVGELIEKYDLSWDHVFYHKQFANTLCCGHFLIEQIKQHLKGRRGQC